MAGETDKFGNGRAWSARHLLPSHRRGTETAAAGRAAGRGDLLRHPFYTRVWHWLVAIAFILSLLSGFALYTPWLFRFLTPIFGGGAMTRFLHPWFGLFFDIFFVFQFLNWFGPMAWTEADRRWLKRIKEYTTNKDKLERENVGFFNGGQKLYFLAIV